MVVEVGQGSLQWLLKNDMLTRSRMASLIQRSYTGGSALKEALHQTPLEWRSPALQSSGSLPKAKGQQPPPEPPNPPPAKRPRSNQAGYSANCEYAEGGQEALQGL